ncbi:MAG: endonuclease/exonuclease/phosphatase family protein [Bacteroidales bacterium]|nr:endonuclease/exonuclease/phosphatase family protein [Bacteroidales bacterium]
MRKRFIFFKTLIWSFVVFLGLALVVSYCSVYVNPISFWIPAFFGLYFVPLVVANAFILLIALLRRSNRAWIPFISLLPTLLFVELFVRWGTNSQNDTQSAQTVKIATYNVCNFQGYGKATRQETVAEISRFLDREQIDVVCMQEFYYPDASKIGELFPSLPYQCFSLARGQRSYRGNIILSRYPILETGELTFPDNQRSCIYADIDLHGQPFRVYTMHFKSNDISLNAIVDRIRNYQETPDEIIRAHKRIREAFRIRAQQVELVTNHLRTVDIPFIFCGDFNDTPVSYTYHQLQKELSDSFRYAGRGFGATFRYLWPALRIDFILYNRAFSIKSHVTVKAPFSDHYPVITELITL